MFWKRRNHMSGQIKIEGPMPNGNPKGKTETGKVLRLQLYEAKLQRDTLFRTIPELLHSYETKRQRTYSQSQFKQLSDSLKRPDNI
jgi:hypothetical protein